MNKGGGGADNMGNAVVIGGGDVGVGGGRAKKGIVAGYLRFWESFWKISHTICHSCLMSTMSFW